MGRFDGVLLASDFDNTLIYTEDALLRGEPIPPLPERNRQALTYFMAEGGRFAISTGRALAAFEKYAPLVPMNAPGVICPAAGGAHPAPAGAEPAGADVFHGGGRPVRHLHRPGPGGL